MDRFLQRREIGNDRFGMSLEVYFLVFSRFNGINWRMESYKVLYQILCISGYFVGILFFKNYLVFGV